MKTALQLLLEKSIESGKNIAIQKKMSFQVEIKEDDIATEETSLVVTGMASTPDIDRYDDIVHPMAFAKSLEQYLKNPQVLLQHNHDKPIGVTEEATIGVTEGLKVKCRISINEDNVFDKIKNGVMRAFSIGFMVKAYQWQTIEWKEIRVITELDLIEISVVAVPANPKCLFTMEKSLKSLFIESKSAEDEPNDDQTDTSLTESQESQEWEGQGKTEGEAGEITQKTAESKDEQGDESSLSEDEVKRIVSEATAPILATVSALKSQISDLEAKMIDTSDTAKQALINTTRKAVPYGIYSAPRSETKTDKSFNATILNQL